MRTSLDLHQQPAGARRWSSLALKIVGACVLLVWASFALSQRSTGRVASRVRIADCDLSRLTPSAARARVNAWLEQRAASSYDFTIAGHPVTVVPHAVGLRADVEGALARASAVGHEGPIWSRFAHFLLSWVRPERVPLTLSFDAPQLERLFDEWQARSILDPPFAGGLTIGVAGVTPLYPHPGRVLDRVAGERILAAAIVRGRGGDALPMLVRASKTDRARVDAARALAESMLDRDLELANADGSRRWLVTRAEIAPLLQVNADPERGTLDISCALDATRRLVEPHRAALEVPAENARFVIDPLDHVGVEPGHAALVLDDAALARALCTAAQSPTKKAELPVHAGAEPALSSDLALGLGVAGLVSTFTTRHACCQPRVQNIHHIADLLDGTLVKPGETFSVNQVVGQRSLKNGFRLAPSIEDGDMVDTVGGGVSQFATTLFNALFYGGYDILERQPHSYWFTRYPMGYDATLSYPHPDIVFKNDTNAGALIKTSYTETSITVKIYGDNGGRRVRAEVSPRQNIVPPPLERIPNPRLDADEEKTREGGMIGWTVVVKRTLTFADGKIKEERRKVTYKPRARRVEVHPCKIPEGEPGHTGERCPKPDPAQAEGSESADSGAK